MKRPECASRSNFKGRAIYGARSEPSLRERRGEGPAQLPRALNGQRAQRQYLRVRRSEAWAAATRAMGTRKGEQDT